MLRALLAKVAEHVPAPTPQQKTYFSIGGRGHWENSTSDVLAFFLKPHEQHEFGPLFLRAFFDCMGDVNADELDLENNIQVRVEESLPGGRIDLVVRAPGWILAIENKIYHSVANDLDAYEKYVRSRAGPDQKVYLALLRPERDKVVRRWKTVTYRDLCEALQVAFKEAFASSPFSRWQFFAREFIDHLQSLLYPLPMKFTEEQCALVESHLAEISTLKLLSNAYDKYLIDELNTRLTETSLDHAPFAFYAGTWALLCDSQKGEKWELALLTPAHQHGGNPERKFIAGVHLLSGADEALQRSARHAFDSSNGVYYWDSGWWKRSHEKRADAVENLCEMARLLFGSEQAQS
jgi:hypothetical protein